MELEQEDGNSIPIEFGSPTFIGRELGLGLGPSSSSDRSISRRHVSLQFQDTRGDKVDTNDHGEDLLLSFEVVGKNPILVCSKGGEGNRIYRSSEKGELKAGDRFSLSIESPNFFLIKRKEGRKGEVESSVLDALARRERRTQQRRKEAEEWAKLEEVGGENEEVVWGSSGLAIVSIDISEIDAVKEFRFLVRGHEFDDYPRHKICPCKEWNWFLEDLRGANNEDDDEDEAFRSSLKGKHHKKKKGFADDDEDWIGENEDLSTSTSKPGNIKRPIYSTRSKDPKKPPIYSTRSKDPKKPRTNIRNSNKPTKNAFNGQPEKLDSEDDETLGGFIVEDVDIEEEEEEVLEEETEEEEEEGDDEESDVD